MTDCRLAANALALSWLALLWAPAVAQPSAVPAGDPVPSSVAADPMFAQPYVDIDEWRSSPVRHRYVHGGFRGTKMRFSFYFPEKAKYEGRFFQYITPVPDSENLSQGLKGPEDRIGFAIASGAYFIETNGGGVAEKAGPGLGGDPSIAAYRANAAAAQYSRVLAEQMYGSTRPYGYAFGGSGGAFRTIGGMENTSGVWDGAVPYVLGAPVTPPNVFTVRMQAMQLLWNKFPQIVDAVEPGGSGNMYDGLTVEQRQALAEATRMGFPPQSWYAYQTMGVHAFTALYRGMSLADPTYFTDFWTKPGYLGFDPPASLVKDRLQFPSKIKTVISVGQAERMNLQLGKLRGQGRGTADQAWQAVGGHSTDRPVAVQLSGRPPKVTFLGGDLVIRSGAAAGKRLVVTKIAGDIAEFGPIDAKTASLIKAGDDVELDNSNFLAAQTYHRHQVPGPEFKVWDQFRDALGKPIYPQRRIQLGPLFTKGAAGTVPTGKFQGKMILVESLWDREAFPWSADWYRDRVKESLGRASDESFRLWYTDHAQHGDFNQQEDGGHTVSYLGVLQQALRDLAAWVEKGILPPETTGYKVVDGQVIVPPEAGDRKGIQPIVVLTADGAKRAEVGVNQPFTLNAIVTVPPGTGRVVAGSWDIDSSSAFATPAVLGTGQDGSATATLVHRFTKPGTYFPVLRATSQRDGNATTPFARIQNIDRVRVVVK